MFGQPSLASSYVLRDQRSDDRWDGDGTWHTVGLLTLDVDDVEPPDHRVQVLEVGEPDLLVPGTGTDAHQHQGVRTKSEVVVVLHILGFPEDEVDRTQMSGTGG